MYKYIIIIGLTLIWSFTSGVEASEIYSSKNRAILHTSSPEKLYTIVTQQSDDVDYNDKRHHALARITFWYPGDDDFGYKSATGVRIKPWVNAAVDPDVIPYFSHVYIKELDRSVTAVDTGSAVISRRAARLSGKTHEQRAAIVIDIPVTNEREYAKWESHEAIFTEVSWN